MFTLAGLRKGEGGSLAYSEPLKLLRHCLDIAHHIAEGFRTRAVLLNRRSDLLNGVAVVFDVSADVVKLFGHVCAVFGYAADYAVHLGNVMRNFLVCKAKLLCGRGHFVHTVKSLPCKRGVVFHCGNGSIDVLCDFAYNRADFRSSGLGLFGEGLYLARHN